MLCGQWLTLKPQPVIVAKQRIEVTRRGDIAAKTDRPQVCDSYKRMQSLLSGQSAEFIDSHHIVVSNIFTMQNYFARYSSGLPVLRI